MAPQTINDEELKITENRQADIEEVADYCVNWIVDVFPIGIELAEELSEEELLNLPEKIGIFSFLNDNEEDIYTKSDGVELE